MRSFRPSYSSALPLKSSITPMATKQWRLSSSTLATILAYSTTSAPLSHEKRMEARMFATTWLTRLLQIYGSNLDPVKDFPTIDRSITAALTDGQNKVREAARVTYWQYAKLSHNTANNIMEDLESNQSTCCHGTSSGSS